MLKKLLSKRHQGRPAQALVEFTLVALTFLFLIVMIIEVARVMQAYVTIQHAAREAVRYAVTGNFDPKYGANPLVGWVPNSGEPLKRIRPCWPLFSDDHYAATASGAGWIDVDLYEPYRNARTCSVEEAAVRGMAGLIMNPNAKITDPDYYDIVVSGYATDIEPTAGNFKRGDGTLTGGLPNMESRPYLNYYHAATDPAGGPYTDGAPYAGDHSAASRGYAGEPSMKVQVQIEYRIRMITPLLSNIAPSVRLYTLASATVESFGSTGLQREAILPPPDVAPQSMKSTREPPDLYVSGFTCPAGPVILGNSIDCTVEVRNKSKDVGAAAGVGKLRVYYLKTTPLSPLDVPFTAPAGMVAVVPDYTIGQLLEGNASPFTQSVSIVVPDKGDYYIYAWADANTTSAPSDPMGQDGVITEVMPGFDGHERITNNLAEKGPISVIEDADLAVTAFTATPPHPGVNPGPLENIVYNVTVTNNGPTPAVNVTVTPDMLMLPPELECVSPLPLCVLNLGNIGSGSTASGSFTLRVKAGTVGPTPTRVWVTAGSDTNDTIPGNNRAYADIDVGGDVSLAILKAVTSPNPATVNYGDTTTQITYTLTVTNLGSGNASSVTVTDVLNSKLVYVPAGSSASCSAAGQTITCGLGALTGGASTPVTIAVKVAAGTPIGDIPNQAEVRCAEMAPTVLSKQSNLVNVTVLGADIEIDKTANVASVLAGGRITYTVRAINPASSYDATGVTVSDPLPNTAPTNYVTHVSNSATQGSYDPVSGLWTVGALPKNTTATLTIVVDVLSSVPVGTNIDNTATLGSSSPPDPNSGNNAETARVTVASASADMVLQKSVSAGTARPGQTLTYTLTLTNNGPTNVTGREVTDNTLLGAFTSTPPLFQFLSASNGGNGTFNATTGRWTGINLVSGTSATLTIQVRVLGRNVDESFMNTAQVLAGTVPEGHIGDESATAIVQIDWPDPVFINAGNWAGGCVTSTWGVDDPTLLRNYTWQVGPSTAWSLLDGPNGGHPRNDNLIDLSFYHFIRHTPDTAPYTPLGVGGQNLFGCSTRTGGGVNNDFVYQFNNLLPGRWRVVLAFAEHSGSNSGRMNIDAYNGVSTQTLLSNYRITDAVIAQPGIGSNYRQWYIGDWWVHYIIQRFDDVAVLSSPGWLQIHIVHANDSSRGRINGLGVEYIGP